jgi:threonine dehydrogenase-like Zn-dependent dehydrogenase
MRAIRLEAPRRVRIEEVPIPSPGPGELRLAVEGCGVCGSDLPVWQGRPWFEYPRPAGAPGHEAWGRVDALGPGVDTACVGDRIAALTYRSYAEFDLVAADAIVPLPEQLDDVPFPGEPLGCAVNVVERAAILAGDTVAVIGTGYLGALIVGFAASRGARVIAISRRATSRSAAAALGADAVLPVRTDMVERVQELNGGELSDVVIEAAGTQQALDLCGPLTRVRGRVVIAGFHQDGPRSVDMQLWNWRGLDVINAHERDQARYVSGIRRAVDAVAGGAPDPCPLLTHQFPLVQAQEAFDLLADRPEGFIKAVMVP